MSSQLKVLRGGPASADDARPAEHVPTAAGTVDGASVSRYALDDRVVRDRADGPAYRAEDRSIGRQTRHELHRYAMFEDQKGGNNTYFETLCYLWGDTCVATMDDGLSARRRLTTSAAQVGRHACRLRHP
jgi:hypothetical protein